MSGTKEYTVRDMFNLWVRNQRKEKPYLILKYPTRAKNSELWYQVKAELNYLNRRVLEIDVEINKLELIDNEISRFTANTTKIFELKKEVYHMHKKIEQLGKEDPNANKKLLDFFTFRDTVQLYNKKAVERIIEGDKINLSEKLGYMYVTKINNPSKLIDWNVSYKFKKELITKGEVPKDVNNPNGVNWLVYYDDPYYFRWSWQKRRGSCRVKNHTVYGFYPTNTSGQGVPGVKATLSQANKANPMLHLKYITR